MWPGPRGALRYVPVLKSLPGELKALAHASGTAWRRMTPLIEIATKRGENEVMRAQSVLARAGDELAAVFSVDRGFFLDFRWVKYGQQVELKGGTKRRAIEQVLQDVCAKALSCVAVVAPGQDPRIVKLVDEALEFAQRGVCVRVQLGGVVRGGSSALAAEIDARVDELRISEDMVDLFLDLGFIGAPSTAKEIAERLKGLEPNKWRSMILAGTVVPDTLKEIDEDTIGALTRYDWLIWKELESLGLERLSYGDYAVQHPIPPVEGGRGMRANVRYTAGDHFLFARGTKIGRGNYSQYQGLCKGIRALKDFRGAAASWGEDEIVNCANGTTLPKAPSDWRAIGTSQHLEHLIRLLEPTSAA
jgi:hypothetical protein